jgi:hypothetical protein
MRLLGPLRSQGWRLLLAGVVFAAYAAVGWSWIHPGGLSGGSTGSGARPAGAEVPTESAAFVRGPGRSSGPETQDLMINLLGFVPLGALLVLLWPRLTVPLAAGLCAAWSFLIEAGQLAVPGHFPSVVDLALNTLGGVLGFLLTRFLLSRRTRALYSSPRSS